jgi:hypothetical protein
VKVTVAKVGTDHDVNDATYYDDDVLYIEDHGVFGVYIANSSDGKHKFYPTNPSIPPGAGDRLISLSLASPSFSFRIFSIAPPICVEQALIFLSI